MKEELACRQDHQILHTGNSKGVVGKGLAMSQQQNYNNDIEKADTGNNSMV